MNHTELHIPKLATHVRVITSDGKHATCEARHAKEVLNGVEFSTAEFMKFERTATGRKLVVIEKQGEKFPTLEKINRKKLAEQPPVTKHPELAVSAIKDQTQFIITPRAIELAIKIGCSGDRYTQVMVQMLLNGGVTIDSMAIGLISEFKRTKKEANKKWLNWTIVELAKIGVEVKIKP